jgi:hypothetical protein
VTRAALTGGGSRWAQDATARVEETTDDDQTCGKTTARLRGWPRQEESRNGATNRWLAGGKHASGLPQSREKLRKGGESLGRRPLL